MTTRTPRAVRLLPALLIGAAVGPVTTLATTEAASVHAQTPDTRDTSDNPDTADTAPTDTDTAPTDTDTAPTGPPPVLDACPIEGQHDLIDSWGWRRSGGRSHQGIDIVAARGTELYAVADGWVNMKRSNLGGNAIWLTTEDGDEFYYAHLDRFEGDDRMVTAGELIGYVGSTGNAGGPHLHFEVHPGGSVENPFDHVVEACTEPAPTAAAPERVPEPATELSSEARVPAASTGARVGGSAIDQFLARLRADRATPTGTPHLRHV